MGLGCQPTTGRPACSFAAKTCKLDCDHLAVRFRSTRVSLWCEKAKPPVEMRFWSTDEPLPGGLQLKVVR